MARCKYGKLKYPIGRRRCKKRKARGGKRRARKGAKRGKRMCKNISLTCRTVRPGLPKICTVSVTGESPKTMTSKKAGGYVSTIVKALRRRGCHPVVTRA
jgi:hypothetical protein